MECCETLNCVQLLVLSDIVRLGITEHTVRITSHTDRSAKKLLKIKPQSYLQFAKWHILHRIKTALWHQCNRLIVVQVWHRIISVIHRTHQSSLWLVRISLLTYRSIYGTALTYLQSCFTRVTDMTSRQWLRSSSSHHLAVPRIHLSTLGKRAFSVSSTKCATVFHLMSHQCRHLRFLDSASSRSCSLSLIWTFISDSHSLLLSLHLCGHSSLTLFRPH